MLSRLPYRLQIPLGLSLAVLLAAALVTVVAAQISASTARTQIVANVGRGATLLGAQALPHLDANDTWQVFVLLRNTTPLLPGAQAGLGRAAVLNAQGQIIAASDPARLPTKLALSEAIPVDQTLPALGEVEQRLQIEQGDGSLVLIDPIRSEDGQKLGYTYIEIDALAFAPDWRQLAQPALVGVLLAGLLRVPAGWLVGRRMTKPIAQIAHVIDQIGQADSAQLLAGLPRSRDPELGRIGTAVSQLVVAMQDRRRAQQRAMSAERMAAVGRMTAAVAHEINNPLGGMLNATQTLAAHGGTEHTRGRALDLLQRGLQQIQATVAALLPQARVEDRPLEVDDLDDVARLAQPTASRYQVRLTTEVDVESALRVPSASMRQVMLNLILNACKAAGADGTVAAVLQGDADHVRFIVSNSGERLTAAALEQIVLAEAGNDPRGVGLWVCREIASQYGGGFHVDEAVSSGTRLVFWMPNTEINENALTH